MDPRRIEDALLDLPVLVDRSRLLRLGLTENSIDYIWGCVPLVRPVSDSKAYAHRDDVIDSMRPVERWCRASGSRSARRPGGHAKASITLDTYAHVLVDAPTERLRRLYRLAVDAAAGAPSAARRARR